MEDARRSAGHNEVLSESASKYPVELPSIPVQKRIGLSGKAIAATAVDHYCNQCFRPSCVNRRRAAVTDVQRHGVEDALLDAACSGAL